jgi:hypothetical protein
MDSASTSGQKIVRSEFLLDIFTFLIAHCTFFWPLLLLDGNWKCIMHQLPVARSCVRGMVLVDFMLISI